MEDNQPNGMAVPLTTFGVGAVVALLVGVYGAIHEPASGAMTSLGFDTVLEMKVVLTVAIGVLAVLQVLGALAMYGKLWPRPPSWVGTAHRTTGLMAVLLSVFVAYHCLWAFGLEAGSMANGEPVPTRVVLHGLAGSAVVGAVVTKVVAVRAKKAAGWVLPVAGGLLFALLVVTVLTSAVWYLAEMGWPSAGGY